MEARMLQHLNLPSSETLCSLQISDNHRTFSQPEIVSSNESSRSLEFSSNHRTYSRSELLSSNETFNNLESQPQ
jgi:hypothetical protein